MGDSIRSHGSDTEDSRSETPLMNRDMMRDDLQQNISIYDTTRADALSTPLLWKHAYGEDRLEYSKENDELWEILNELAENERILDNKIALLHEEQRRMFEIARNSNSRENATTFDKSKQFLPDISKVLNRAGKSRRVFRKKTKITRRSNKKSNRSRSHRRHHRHHHHHHRRTSHVAKQT